jgi:hypothetical protein
LVNPVTNQLLSQERDARLRGWVRAWDQLEATAIEVYRHGSAGWRQRRRFHRARQRLLRDYPAYRAELARHWDGLLAAGEPLDADPFAALLGVESAAMFAGNWRAMQLLPAAREAVNGLLLARIERGDPSA